LFKSVKTPSYSVGRKGCIEKRLLEVGDLIYWTRDGEEAIAIVVEIDEQKGYRVFWNDSYVQWICDWVLTEPPMGLAGNWRVLARLCHEKTNRME